MAHQLNLVMSLSDSGSDLIGNSPSFGKLWTWFIEKGHGPTFLCVVFHLEHPLSTNPGSAQCGIDKQYSSIDCHHGCMWTQLSRTNSVPPV